MIIQFSTFEKNFASINGLAIYILIANGNIHFETNNFFDNSIQNNIQSLGSVLYLDNPGNISITNCIFSKNIGIIGTCIYYSETSVIKN